MLKCAKCGSGTSVFKTTQETKQLNGKTYTLVRRKRKCPHCNCRFSTIEVVESEQTTWVPTIGEERFMEK